MKNGFPIQPQAIQAAAAQILALLTSEFLVNAVESEPYLTILSGKPVNRLPDRTLANVQQQEKESKQQRN
jgi:hypothetical protein